MKRTKDNKTVAIIFAILAAALYAISTPVSKVLLQSVPPTMAAFLYLGATVCWGLENNCTRQIAGKDPMEIVTVKGFGSGMGALCIPDNWRERYPEVADIPDTTRLWDVPMGRRFFLELRDIDVFKTIGKYQGPVLIVQGDRDAVVRMEDSRRAVKTYSNARLSVIPGAGHGFQPDEQARSLREIKTFLEELPDDDKTGMKEKRASPWTRP